MTNRTVYRGSQRNALEKLAQSPDFTCIYADTRTEPHLLSFTFPKNSVDADLNIFRRAKSNDEVAAIQEMTSILEASRNNGSDENHFRGTVESLNYKHAMQEHPGKHFTLRRYGLQDSYGRSVELSTMEPHTEDWKSRAVRIDNGCNAVARQLKEGAVGHDIDETFRSYLNPNTDVVYGSVLHHSGYQPWESDLKVDVVQKYDVLTVCPVVGDTAGNWIPHMHSIHTITDDARFRGNEDKAADDRRFRAEEGAKTIPKAKPRFEETTAYLERILDVVGGGDGGGGEEGGDDHPKEIDLNTDISDQDLLIGALARYDTVYRTTHTGPLAWIQLDTSNTHFDPHISKWLHATDYTVFQNLVMVMRFYLPYYAKLAFSDYPSLLRPIAFGLFILTRFKDTEKIVSHTDNEKTVASFTGIIGLLENIWRRVILPRIEEVNTEVRRNLGDEVLTKIVTKYSDMTFMSIINSLSPPPQSPCTPNTDSLEFITYNPKLFTSF